MMTATVTERPQEAERRRWHTRLADKIAEYWDLGRCAAADLLDRIEHWIRGT